MRTAVTVHVALLARTNVWCRTVTVNTALGTLGFTDTVHFRVAFMTRTFVRRYTVSVRTAVTLWNTNSIV